MKKLRKLKELRFDECSLSESEREKIRKMATKL